MKVVGALAFALGYVYGLLSVLIEGTGRRFYRFPFRPSDRHRVR